MHTSGEPSSGESSWKGAKDFIYGCIAGVTSKIIEHPFDLCKVRLQTQVLDQNARFSGPADCLHQTWKYEGIRGLYRGLPAPIVAAMTENAVLFTAYNQFLSTLRAVSDTPVHSESVGQIAGAAAGAGVVASFFLTPIELIKCKMQVQMMAAVAKSPLSKPGLPQAAAAANTITFSQLPGPITLIRTVIRTQGFKGMWLGHTGTMLRETGGSAAWFTAKETVSRALLSRRARIEGRNRDQYSTTDLRAWESVLAGACGGIAYTVSLFPADSVKSAMQTEEEMRPRPTPNASPLSRMSSSQGEVLSTRRPLKPTFLSTFRALYARQGIRGLYAGCGIGVIRSAPGSGVIFLVYDTLVKYFG